MAGAAGREKMPFEAVYPYVSAPTEQIFVSGKAKSAGILGGSFEHGGRSRTRKDAF